MLSAAAVNRSRNPGIFEWMLILLRNMHHAPKHAQINYRPCSGGL